MRTLTADEIEQVLVAAPCVVPNPWGARWDGPCTGAHADGGAVHIPCAVAALTTAATVEVPA